MAASTSKNRGNKWSHKKVYGATENIDAIEIEALVEEDYSSQGFCTK